MIIECNLYTNIAGTFKNNKLRAGAFLNVRKLSTGNYNLFGSSREFEYVHGFVRCING